MLENKTVEAHTEKHDATETENGPNKREAVRVVCNSADRPVEAVELNNLLYLSIPHLSNSVEYGAECNKKRILIARRDGSDGHSHTRQHKSDGPLSVIAQILGIHRCNTPFVEIKLRFHLEHDGSFSQELVLPPGWVVVD